MAQERVHRLGPLAESLADDASYMEEDSINHDSYMPDEPLDDAPDEEGMNGSTGCRMTSLS